MTSADDWISLTVNLGAVAINLVTLLEVAPTTWNWLAVAVNLLGAGFATVALWRA